MPIDVSASIHRRVNRLQRKIGTAHLRFHHGQAKPGAAGNPVAIGQDERRHAERERGKRELRQRPHATPAQEHQHRQHDHPERIVRPVETRREIRCQIASPMFSSIHIG